MSKKSSLLIDTEDVLIVLTPLAVLVGDREAIALQQIHYWIEINRKAQRAETHFIDGLWWVYNTWGEWQASNFPFWSIATIQRIFDSLFNKDLIIRRPHENHNKGLWVAILYGELEGLKNSGETLRKRVSKRVKPSQTDKATGNTETNTETTPETTIVPDGTDGDSKPSKKRKKKAEPKPRKEVEPEPLYEAVELHVFGIKPDEDAPYDWNGRCGVIARWLNGQVSRFRDNEFGRISSPALPEHVKRFADDYRQNNERASLPKDPVKFVENWRKWASSLKSATPKPQPATNTAPTPEQQAAAKKRVELMRERLAATLAQDNPS